MATSRRLELVVDERLEQLQRHLLGQTALVQLQLGPDDDDRAAGVVDALAEQVLTEAALLALQRVGQRLQRTVVRATQHAAAAAVVEQRIDRFLQHALLVADDDVGRLQLDQLLQPVVAVDDAAIEVVEVRGREPAAVERHQRRSSGGMTGMTSRIIHSGLLVDLRNESTTRSRLRTSASSAPRLGAFAAELLRELIDVDALQQLLDRLGAHLRAELHRAVLFTRLCGQLLGEQLVLLEIGVARIDDDVSLEERMRSISRSEMSRWPMRLGRPLKNHTWLTGVASVMCPGARAVPWPA